MRLSLCTVLGLAYSGCLMQVEWNLWVLGLYGGVNTERFSVDIGELGANFFF